jgi:hypothetical protein
MTVRERAIHGHHLTGLDLCEYDRLLTDLVEERRACAATHRLRDSARLTDAIAHVTACRLEERKYRLQVAACDEFNEQATRFEDSIREYDSETARLEEALQQRLSQQRARLLQAHERLTAAHARSWTSPAKRRQYNHASSELCALRRQFRLYVKECQFVDAEEVSGLIARAEGAERADAGKQMQHDFEESQKKLKARMQAELDWGDEAARVQLAQLRQRRAWGRQLYVNKRRKIEARAEQVSDSDRLWNAHLAELRQEVSRGSRFGETMRLARLTDEDVPSGDDTTIALPALRLTATL